ncbi:unnamed protein product [Diabrotica balteata]|uniref:Uncharacterized protein n=1 Tax=Diabrotica balteata TaxID=107213 RepID=A0A9N9T5T6_DIABA|nr:unnamed protein product [Diabrotica balteata]
MKLKISTPEEKKIESELADHHQDADNTYIEKRNGKNMAKDDEIMRCYTFDLQQCLPTPMLNTSVAFYKSHLWTYNLTMHEASTGNVTCYMWHEAEGTPHGM